FFQAEDGIRDATVTGVQTCALPIFASIGASGGTIIATIITVRGVPGDVDRDDGGDDGAAARADARDVRPPRARRARGRRLLLGEIGRASCRESGWVSGAVMSESDGE